MFINEHSSIEDRVAAAKNIRKVDESIPMYIDGLNDSVNRAFGAYPDRLYILLDNTVVYQGGMGPFGYSLDEVELWLEHENRGEENLLHYSNPNVVMYNNYVM